MEIIKKHTIKLSVDKVKSIIAKFLTDAGYELKEKDNTGFDFKIKSTDYLDTFDGVEIEIMPQ